MLLMPLSPRYAAADMMLPLLRHAAVFILLRRYAVIADTLMIFTLLPDDAALLHADTMIRHYALLPAPAAAALP